jgi:hypothetical protein
MPESARALHPVARPATARCGGGRSGGGGGGQDEIERLNARLAGLSWVPPLSAQKRAEAPEEYAREVSHCHLVDFAQVDTVCLASNALFRSARSHSLADRWSSHND